MRWRTFGGDQILGGDESGERWREINGEVEKNNKQRVEDVA